MKKRLAKLAKEAREQKALAVDSFFRSVYDSLSVRVLAEAVANTPPTGDELEAIETGIENAKPAPIVTAKPPKKRTRTV